DEDITLREENALPNYIGDGTIGGRNVMGNVLNEDFGDTGIYVFDSEVHINNNYVGVAVDGASPANIVGECVLIDSDFDPYMSTVVNNVIGYCSDDGVALRRSDNINAPTTALAGDGPRSFLVDNNKIGLEVSGNSPAQIGDDCVDLDRASSTTISNNVIGNCRSVGIRASGDLFGDAQDDLFISNNIIGLQANGTTPAPIGVTRSPFSFYNCINLYAAPSANFDPTTVTGTLI